MKRISLCVIYLLFIMTLPVHAQINYPSSKPEVKITDTTITILFPQKAGITLKRKKGKSFSSIEKLYVEERDLVSEASTLSSNPPTLEIYSNDKVGEIKNWETYLQDRAKINRGKPEEEWIWPKRGERKKRTISLDNADYIDKQIIDDKTVVIKTRITDKGKSYDLDWIFTYEKRKIGNRTYEGLGWKFKIIGLKEAAFLHFMEPALYNKGAWFFSQTWGTFVENRLGIDPALTLPRQHAGDAGWYFADIQPFFFLIGNKGAVVSFFDQVVAVKVKVEQRNDRLFNNLKIPLGKGSTRVTPTKFWLVTKEPFPTKWLALDEWTSVLDSLYDYYRKPYGLKTPDPKPTLVWIWPSEEYYRKYKFPIVPTFKDSWLYQFSRTTLREAANLGIRVVYIQNPWDSDAIHSEGEYYAGSLSFGSGHAPWELEISKAIGGEKALQELIKEADKLDVKIILWSTPAHFSNSSRKLKQNTEWMMWTSDGTPVVEGYIDITGVSLKSGYYDYAINQYKSIHERVPYHGIWIDSFLTFGVSTDFSQEQPTPQLDLTLKMQQEFSKMGLKEIYIEGTGPFGLGNGGCGSEGIEFGGPEDKQEIMKCFELQKNHEYGYYYQVADNPIEPNNYYRTLASKGVVGAAILKSINKLKKDKQKIIQANKDYNTVLSKMKKRHLIGQGNTWQGVSWTRKGSHEIVLFAFTKFTFPLRGKQNIYDVTARKLLVKENIFQPEPMHTYIINPEDPTLETVKDLMVSKTQTDAITLEWTSPASK